jgi:aromatic-L-amino-acid decarboxylase
MPSADLSPELFLKAVDRAARHLVETLESSEKRRVFPNAPPGVVRGAIPSRAPRTGEPLDAILDDFERLIAPNLTQWNHPSFFAYFAISSSYPAMVADLLSAGYNVNAMLWRTSPAATELELAVCDWLREAMGLAQNPASPWHGVMHDTASLGTVHALLAAREDIGEVNVHDDGLAGGPRLRMYASEQAHSSVERAGLVLGLGRRGFRAIATDRNFRMKPDALAAAIREDRAQGYRPFAVTAAVGTTSTTSADPVNEIADICEREALWLHVDAAYAGSVALCEEFRPHFAGWERAQSIAVNPMKWLFVPVDLSVLYTRKPEAVRRALSLSPEYLRAPEHQDAPNLMDYSIALGRRFRALKLWMVMRAFGTDGLKERLREHCRLARLFADLVREAQGFELSAPVPFSTVCFRAVFADARDDAEQDARNERLMNAVNATGEMFFSHTKLHGRLVLRLAIGNIRTEERHVRDAFQRIVAEKVRQ